MNNEDYISYIWKEEKRYISKEDYIWLGNISEILIDSHAAYLCDKCLDNTYAEKLNISFPVSPEREINCGVEKCLNRANFEVKLIKYTILELLKKIN